MNDDSSGIDGTGPSQEGSASDQREDESADLTRLLVQGFEPITPLPDVWDRIGSHLWDGNETRPKLRQLAFTTAAAVLVLLIGAVGTLGAIAVRPDSTNQPSMVAPATTIRDLSDPTTGTVELTIHTGSDGSSIALSTGSLPALEPGFTYQLWSVAGDKVVSIGLLGRSIGSSALRLEGDPEILALTVETAGGVAVSSATPVAVWTSTD